jgi:hypothetical protein
MGSWASSGVPRGIRGNGADRTPSPRQGAVAQSGIVVDNHRRGWPFCALPGPDRSSRTGHPINLLWLNTFDKVEELRRGFQDFVAHYSPPGSLPDSQPTLGRLNSAADCLKIRTHYTGLRPQICVTTKLIPAVAGFASTRSHSAITASSSAASMNPPSRMRPRSEVANWTGRRR